MLYLASKSPRRRELLTQASVDFCLLEKLNEARELQFDECFYSELAIRNAILKAEANENNIPHDGFVLGCDTVIEFGEIILGKPKDLSDAKEMLKLLANKSHYVNSAVCLINKTRRIKTVFIDTAEVKFCKFSDAVIDDYLANVEVLDKAGSYALQHVKSQNLIDKVIGDPTTVIGLPMEKLLQTLRIYGLSITS